MLCFWSRNETIFIEGRKIFGPDEQGDLEWFRNEAAKAHPYYTEQVIQRMKEYRENIIKDGS